ncbi:MAG: hypothetical protein A3K83_04070 [Omnitrophica WOR_2 bacterium RBG_13_44_8b]|nr:MAG: hypothetical protein A3K83_04070 [Omnitrophica WOR_2 bacterium RBG_13_44_8b]
MTVGILKIALFIHDSNSLKEKRMVLHSLKAKIRNNFNVAVTQIEDDDKWQKTTLAIVGAERDRKNMDSILSKIIDFIERFDNVNLINHEMELI